MSTAHISVMAHAFCPHNGQSVIPSGMSKYSTNYINTLWGHSTELDKQRIKFEEWTQVQHHHRCYVLLLQILISNATGTIAALSSVDHSISLLSIWLSIGWLAWGPLRIVCLPMTKEPGRMRTWNASLTLTGTSCEGSFMLWEKRLF